MLRGMDRANGACHGEDIDWERDLVVLGELLEASKTPNMCSSIVVPRAKKMMNLCIESLGHIVHDTYGNEKWLNCIVKSLCIVRNMLATGECATEKLMECDLKVFIASITDILHEQIHISGRAQLARLVAQVVANATTACPGCIPEIWKLLFPSRFLYLGLIDSVDTANAVALALLNACNSFEEAECQLVSKDGCLVISVLLQAEERLFSLNENDTLGLLLMQVCIRKGNLERLMDSLGKSDEVCMAPTNLQLNSNHVLLMRKLVYEAQEFNIENLLPVDGALGADPKEPDTMLYLVELTIHLAQQSGRSDNVVEKQMLQEILRFLREIASRDDDGRALANGRSLVAEMTKAHLVEYLLLMLRAQSQPADRNGGSSTKIDLHIPDIKIKPSFITKQAYPGFKSDIISVIANMSHRRKDIQALIHGTGGVYLILNHCQADVSSPLAREWALWAIRNICEGSKEAREAIGELQKLGVEQSTQFDKAGLSVVYDEESNRLRIKKL
eukprot:jgi/Picsp_1/5101/NSC_02464-R1_protein